MSPELDEQDNFDFFKEKYSRPRSQAARQVERTVLGHEAGLNGYTTVEQAEELYEYLALMDNHHLLDVGGGHGWPGLHLAARSSCALASTDIPFEALREAKVNIAARSLQAANGVIAADGRALPFLSGSFDAIVHADVFC